MGSSISTALAGLHVLLVEDEYLQAHDVARMLETRGARVGGPCSSVMEARDILADGPVDMAILDINLGDHDVLSLAAELQDSGLPIVFLTGYARSAIDDRFASVPHVRKPAEHSTIEQALTSLVMRSDRVSDDRCAN